MIFLPKFPTKVLFTSVPESNVESQFRGSMNDHLIFFSDRGT